MYRIFVSGMAYDEGKSGISDYTNNVLKELVKNHKIDFLMFKKDVDIFPFRHKNLTILTVQDSLSKPIINMLWHLFILPISRNFRKYDFIFLPAGNRRLFWIYPQFTITTFHDLSQFHIQGKYDKLRMIYIKKIIPFFLKKVHRIFAISESTKNDLMRFYHLETNKIQVNYNGYNQENFRSDIVVDRKDLPIPIDKNFLLYISRIEHPGKNHLNLIKAYEILPDEIKEQYHLVFVGKVWAGSELVSEYARNSKDSSRIHLLGFVAYDLLPKLYKAATLYVLPSLYEGFGIPLLEAMACGTPVICSNVSSLPEVGGNAVITFNPHNVKEISQTIINTLVNVDLQNQMIEKGLEQVKKFDWRDHAEKIVNEFQNS